MNLRLAALPALLLFLAACATGYPGNAIAPGTPRDELLARLGPPTRALPLEGGGQRLQYSQQPAGRHAWMIDLDAAGRVVRQRQVLAEAEFQRIVPGRWTRADVEREFGPPAWEDRVASWQGPVLNYRWRDATGADMFYWVYLDPQGVVQRAHPGMEVRDRLLHFRF